jgi:subtilase family serine protease
MRMWVSARSPMRKRGKLVLVALAGLAVVLVPAAQGANGNANYHAVCPAPPSDSGRCHVLVVTDRQGNPLASTSPSGLSPATIKSVYGFPAGNDAGAGTTIAIVDAYDDPNAEDDLNVFSSTFGLPACTTANGCFKKVNQTGGTSYPRSNSGWALEISLDVQWAHAIAPGAKILLVEAKSNSLSNLFAAESYAKQHADYVSNSWGASEFSSESLYDSYFVQPGVSVFASAGDSGLPASYPSASPSVISVGGTTLTQNGDGTWSETGWSDGGGGCSAYETATSAQAAFSEYGQASCGGKRATPDVSLDADPSSGVSVYDSVPYSGQSGWWTVGGTSASSPMWAAASADFGTRVDASAVYGSTITFNDVISGNNGASCLTGYDLCSGRGSWIYSSASKLSGGGSTQSPDFTIAADPSTQNVMPADSTQYNVSTTAINNDTDPVTLSVSGLPSGASGSFSSNPVSPGSSSTLAVTTASGTPVGNYTLTISGSDGTNSHQTTVTLAVTSASQSTMAVTLTAGTLIRKGPNYRVPLTVTAADDGSGNPIAGASVQLSVFQGPTCGGSPVASSSSTTDASGQMSVNFQTRSTGSWCARASVTASGYNAGTADATFATG